MCVWILFRMLAVILVSDFFALVLANKFFCIDLWNKASHLALCNINNGCVSEDSVVCPFQEKSQRASFLGSLQQGPLFVSAKKPLIDLVMFVSVANAGKSLWY